MGRKTKEQILREEQEQKQKAVTTQWITSVILFALAIVGIMKLGVVGTFLYNLCRYLIGDRFLLLFGLAAVWTSARLYLRRQGNDVLEHPYAFLCVMAALVLIAAVRYTPAESNGLYALSEYSAMTKEFFSANPPESCGGGILGAFLYAVISAVISRGGVYLTIAVLLIIAVILFVPPAVWKKAGQTVQEFLARPDDEPEPAPVREPEEEHETPNIWRILSERKEKKKKAAPAQNTPRPVQATPRPVQTRTQPITPAPVSGQSDPARRRPFAIDADDPTETLSLDVPEMGKKNAPIEIEMAPNHKSIFIDADNTGAFPADGQYSHYIPESEETYEPEPVQEVIPVEEEEAPVQPEPVQPARKEPVQPAQPAQPARPRNLRRKHAKYTLPNPAAVLDPASPHSQNPQTVRAAREQGEMLIRILKNFDVEAKLIDVHIGPAVTQYEIRPDANVKVSKINTLADDIKMQMAVRDVRIEAPIPGRNAVGIEVPNTHVSIVKMRELVSAETDKSPLLFYVGKDLLGNCVTCRLDKMPHLLIAGATGSGKSVCMNAIITSLLLRTDPEEVKMLLIDPKKVEFTPYRNIPHLIGPVINDAAKAANALQIIVNIMDARYNIFAENSVRNIAGYNALVEKHPEDPGLKKMPYIVVIIDELADLMLVAGKEVEASIQRITQLARAAGIHLIVATQRPSTDVITGVIKANIPSRIAFAVSSGIDSRTILDHIGAERLLGNGDMLFAPSAQKPQRVQGVFLTDEEVQRVTEFVSAQAVPMYDDAFVLLESAQEGGFGMGGASDDPLYEEVKEYVIQDQKASTSLLQRRFGIGYNRAARMIDLLEENGVIGPARGSKPREVFLKPEESSNRTETGGTW